MSYYDNFGRRLAVSQASQASSGSAQTSTSVFAYDAAGEIIQRRVGTVSGSTFTPYNSLEIDHYSYVNGQQVSDVDEAGDITAAGVQTSFSSGDSSSNYVVQAGDTLESIAQTVYGNSQLSYILAEANGLQDSGLVVGQRIVVPSVTTHSNDANTFQPYNPGKIIGSTTPTLPLAPPPPPKQHCEALAQVVAVAVTIVVSYYAHNPVTGAAAGNVAGQAASAMLNGQFDWHRFATHELDPFHGSDLNGTLTEFTASPILSGAMFWSSSGGNDLDRALWNPIENGMPKGFDRKSTVIAVAAAEAASEAGEYYGAAYNAYAAAAAWGVASYGTSYAAGRLLGERDTHFSVGGLLGSVAGAVAGQGVANSAPFGSSMIGSYANQVAGNATYDVVNREVGAALGNSHVESWKQIGEDVFGNVLANATIAYNLTPPTATSASAVTSWQDYLKTRAYIDAESAQNYPIEVDGGVGTNQEPIQDSLSLVSPQMYGAGGQTNAVTQAAASAPPMAALGGVVPVAPNTFLTSSQQQILYRALNDPLNIDENWNVSVGADGDLYVSGRYHDGAVDTPGVTVGGSIRDDQAMFTLPSNFTFVTQDKRSGAQRQAQSDATFNQWWYDENVRAISFASKIILAGVTAGVGGAITGSALVTGESLGMRLFYSGYTWGVVAADTNAGMQLVDMATYRSTNGAVGQKDFSWGSVGLSAAFGVVSSIGLELVAPYLAKGASWLFDQMFTGLESNGLAPRLTSEQINSIFNESGGPQKLSELSFDANEFRLTDSMNDKQFTRLVKSISVDGFQNPVIQYTVVDDEPFIVVGNNRFLAAKRLGLLEDLSFQKVNFPVRGTNFNTAEDVLNTIGAVRLPKYRGQK